MRASQIVALIAGIVLAFPGLCFASLGGGLMSSGVSDDVTVGGLFLLVGLGVLGLAGGLVYFATRRSKTPPTSGSTGA